MFEDAIRPIVREELRPLREALATLKAPSAASELMTAGEAGAPGAGDHPRVGAHGEASSPPVGKYPRHARPAYDMAMVALVAPSSVK
jgi:hypothetical protein